MSSMKELTGASHIATEAAAIEFLEPEPNGNDRWDKVLGVGTAVIAGLATMLSRSQQAAASHECLGQPHCCTLATCTWCNYQVNPDRFTCPSGYNRFTWSCMEGSQLAWCGECTTSTEDCFHGDIICSAWFWN